ncbi:hypothetical protein EDD11_003885 [Mortierella claussenii]|nr:hypothetical protein EDD11_003885 [Mortierella claussenii]
MSSFDASDPFDSSQAWQNVPSNSNSTWRNTSSTTAAQHNHSDDIPVAIPAAPATPLVQPSAPSLHTSSETTITKMVATSSSSSTSTSTPRSATTTTTVIAAAAAKATAVAQFEDLPPSYEAAIFKDRPQIHDNYDHLRGPVGQRGQDIKARIPLDSTPSSYYQSGGGASSGGSGSGSGSGSRSAAAQGSSTGSHSQVNPNSGARVKSLRAEKTMSCTLEMSIDS